MMTIAVSLFGQKELHPASLRDRIYPSIIKKEP
jgi:hypothetical protein